MVNTSDKYSNYNVDVINDKIPKYMKYKIMDRTKRRKRHPTVTKTLNILPGRTSQSGKNISKNIE